MEVARSFDGQGDLEIKIGYGCTGNGYISFMFECDPPMAEEMFAMSRAVSWGSRWYEASRGVARMTRKAALCYA